MFSFSSFNPCRAPVTPGSAFLLGAFAPGNLTVQGSLDCRIGAVRMQTGGRLGALGGGRRAAPGTWLCVRPWPGTLRVCSPQPLVPSWVGSARLREEGPACVLRCALRGMEMGSRPPPTAGERASRPSLGRLRLRGLFGSHLWDLFPFLIEGVTAAILRSDYFEDPNHI